MNKKKLNNWTFTSRFRTNAYGWNRSRLACQRIKEAVSEVRKVSRKDPMLGAEGAIKLMEKLWPALQHVDSSSGALGTAVNNAMGVLVDVVVEAPVDNKNRALWRLYSTKSSRLYEDYVELHLEKALKGSDEWEYGLFEAFFHKECFLNDE